MAPSEVQLLLVEPQTAEAERLQALLRSVPEMNCGVRVIPNLGVADAAMDASRPDLLVLSLETGRADSLEKVLGFRRQHPWVPVLVIATDHDPTAAAAIVAHGAQDCLGQEDLLPDLIGRAVRYALARHRTEAALRANEEFFRLISENVSDLIAVIDRDGRRLYNSPSYERTLGRTAELQGTDSFAEIHPEDRDRIQSVFRETLRSGAGRRTEYRVTLPSGAIRHIESVGSVIRDDQGHPDRVVVVARDVTEQRQVLEGLEHALAQLRKAHQELQTTQQRLVESEKMETVSTFAGAIAHEVKNPLQTILLGLDHLRATVSPDDRVSAGVLTEMEQATRKADAVIRGLMEFAAYGRHEIGEHDLNELVAQSLRSVQPEAEAKRIQLESHLAPNLPRLRFDAKKIKHACLKLLLGAIQVVQVGGELRISTSRREASKLPTLTSPVAGASRVVLEIEDRGNGLLEALSPSRGEREFGTTFLHKPAFDLMVVGKVVELFGASLEAGPREGGGARIAIAFRA